MTLEDYNKWIEMLKTVEMCKGNLDQFDAVFKFSPEKFSKSNGLDTESFVKQFQKERKIIHHRLIDFNKIQILKKRKVKIEKYIHGGKAYDARICVCVKRFKNEEQRARNSYDFYEDIQYNYLIIHDDFFGNDDAIIFYDKGKRVYSTVNEFNKHFIDIREYKINQLLK